MCMQRTHTAVRYYHHYTSDPLCGLLKGCPLGLRPLVISSSWAGTHYPVPLDSAFRLALTMFIPTDVTKNLAPVLCFFSKGYKQRMPMVTSNQTALSKHSTFIFREKLYRENTCYAASPLLEVCNHDNLFCTVLY